MIQFRVFLPVMTQVTNGIITETQKTCIIYTYVRSKFDFMEDLIVHHTNDTPAEISAYEILHDFYKKNSYDFKLVKRVGDIAIFEQICEGKVMWYEVFEIRKQKEADWGEVHYEAKERIPRNEEWGTNAYTVYTLEQAEFRMNQIAETISQREQIK